MPLPRRLVLRLAPGILLGLPVLNACAGSPAAPDAPPIAALIVKPRTPASDADALMRVVRRSLPQPAMARYARPMSGGAHVVFLTPPVTRAQVPALIERLRASGDFEYVELDAPVKAQ
jgi:cell division septation protein DedD